MAEDGDLAEEVARLRARVKELEARSHLDPAVRSIAENSPDNIMLLDRDGCIEYINRTVPDLTREQVLGQPVYQFVGEEFREPIRRALAGVLESGKPGRYETWYVAEDGQKSWWESSV